MYSDDYYSAVAGATVVSSVISTMFIVLAIFYILLIIAQWKIFTKAGEKGWKSLIPIYNLVTLYKIIGLSPWLILIYLTAIIPIVGYIAIFVLMIVTYNKLAKAFGEGTAFTVGLILLNPIFELILAFGSAQYVGVPESSNNDINNIDE